MGAFLRRGGPPGGLASRRLAVLRAVGLVVVVGAVVVGDLALTSGRDRNGAIGGAPAGTARPTPAGLEAAASTPPGGTPGRVASTFGQIILPDLLIVAPDGLTAGQIAGMRAVTGVRNVITFDGAEIAVGGVRVSAIGVNPATFRPWVPLQAASNQPFWSDLARGDFVADASGGQARSLIPGASYLLAGTSAQVVTFGMAASLGLRGVDVLVNQTLSAKLGLIRQVAGLISAPGASITTLQAEVGRILGPNGRIEVLRSQQLTVASVPSGGRPTSYLQLFKASAAGYCPGLSWTVLAAIGQIESGDGQNMGPSSAGALGPMQFLPSTWQTWGIDAFGESGPPNIMDPYDAVPSAARMLCADGAAGGGTALASAIYDYNHADWYVREVLALAAEYAAEYP